ncbi:hypothetical protein [Bifidobacterium biavatii]|nr:hypothetical protein [Bifidobacterium biavatii]
MGMTTKHDTTTDTVDLAPYMRPGDAGDMLADLLPPGARPALCAMSGLVVGVADWILVRDAIATLIMGGCGVIVTMNVLHVLTLRARQRHEGIPLAPILNEQWGIDHSSAPDFVPEDGTRVLIICVDETHRDAWHLIRTGNRLRLTDRDGNVVPPDHRSQSPEPRNRQEDIPENHKTDKPSAMKKRAC